MIKNKAYFTKSIIQDFIVFIIFVLLTTAILIKFDITETIYNFSRTHEELELDELILVLAISTFYLLIFVIKRLIEINKILLIANTDPLLGLINRRKGCEYLQDEIDLIKKAQNTSSLIMFDIDDFKHVNDTYGHEIGDYVLQETCKIIQSHSRDTDTLIRWGGEEFLIICSNTNPKQGLELSQRYRKNIENHNYNNGIKITASFGIIELNCDEDLKTQLKKVDDKLYISKKNGKNRVTS